MTAAKWMSIVLCTLLAGGGVFWAAAEPIAHFVSAPPLYGNALIHKRWRLTPITIFHALGFYAGLICKRLSSIVLIPALRQEPSS